MSAPGGQPRATLEDVLKGAGLTIADFDRWRDSTGAARAADMNPQERDKAAGWLANNPANFDRMRGGEE